MNTFETPNILSCKRSSLKTFLLSTRYPVHTVVINNPSRAGLRGFFLRDENDFWSTSSKLLPREVPALAHVHGRAPHIRCHAFSSTAAPVSGLQGDVAQGGPIKQPLP
jgi:hypothetical protein